MLRRALVALLVACALAREARGAPATARLESANGPGAADCPDAAALAATVNEALGREAALTAGAAPVRVAVSFERAGKGYAATVRVGDGRGGTRRLADRGPGCGALASAVGVLLVVVLDANAEALAGVPGTAAAAVAPPASSAGGAATTADLAVGGGATQGLVGGWSPAIGLGGTLAYGRAAAKLGGVWLPARSNLYGPGRVEVGLAAARLALCASPLDVGPRVGLGLCAQQQVGWMRGEGSGFEAGNRAADHLWLAAGASLVASGPFGRGLGWEVEAGVVRAFRQQRFVVDNLGTAFESDPIAFMTTLAVTTRVW
jgi:hypothetical protein